MLLRQLAAILALPFNVLLVIPGLLFLRCRGRSGGQLLPTAVLPFIRTLGGLLILAGMLLLQSKPKIVINKPSVQLKAEADR